MLVMKKYLTIVMIAAVLCAPLPVFAIKHNLSAATMICEEKASYARAIVQAKNSGIVLNTVLLFLANDKESSREYWMGLAASIYANPFTESEVYSFILSECYSKMVRR
ncbi:hypothetical protein A3C87_02175 [Candidatus Kaiserbacteria bacterium RIFCSPHIGHO2_02_FULL_49_34]|uniref:Uncharacterized protein n=1 Tax=Candidatus Kaiserbacteria bacterium RIFCSPHIGHO2_02_FULL_49_34 TaxID=1798491 RepID=A0A1F6DKW6_9BACT|nr:MAG: hypothetical protein A3C87_02175 [Candidatus Kaiserbacteria bacterium RIFCSPHIGHO2_02_FULL_49_34]